MARSDPTLKKYYRRYNEEHFDGKLPDNVVVRWGTPEEWEEEDIKLIADTDLASNPIEMRFSPWLRRLTWEGVTRFTLYHEMVHIELHRRRIPQTYDHDEHFDKEMLRLAKRGAFAKDKQRSSLW